MKLTAEEAIDYEQYRERIGDNVPPDLEKMRRAMEDHDCHGGNCPGDEVLCPSCGASMEHWHDDGEGRWMCRNCPSMWWPEDFREESE